jgi:hypothetical protein
MALSATSQGIFKSPGRGRVALQLPKRSILGPQRLGPAALRTIYSQLDIPKTWRFLFEGFAVPMEPNLDTLATDLALLDKAAPLAFGASLPFLLSPPITTFNLALIVDKSVMYEMLQRLLIGHTVLPEKG